MRKFERMLSADSTSVLSSRAKNLAETTVIEVESFINNLKKERLTLVSKINDLTDLAPENTFSLRPGSPDFKPSEWVKELHSTRMQLQLKEMELQEAQEIYDEWFEIEKKDDETVNKA